jgi:hypothetical protein
MSESALDLLRFVFFTCRNYSECILDYRAFSLYFDSRRTASLFLSVLVDRKLVSIEEKKHERFLECVAKALKDKRVRNAEQYCKRQYPSTIILQFDCNKIIEEYEEFKSVQPHSMRASFTICSTKRSLVIYNI